MALNIACFSPGCTNPVVGQCPGYGKSCWHFYCAQHSNGKLCDECAEEERVQLTFEDYIQTAERIKKQVGRIEGCVFVLVWLALLALAISNRDIILGVIAYVGGFLVFILLNISWRIRRNSLIATTNISKPGLADFYKEWQKHKNREQMRTVLAIGLGAVAAGVAGAAAESSDKARVRRAVDDELNRRGL